MTRMTPSEAFVEHPDPLGDALGSGRCTVLEVMVNQELAEPFQRDALGKPVRLLEKHREYSVE